MPHSRLEDLPNAATRWSYLKGTTYRVVHWGDMEVGLTDLSAPLDCTESYKLGGLPGGVCPCPHYGYVFEGRIRVVYPDSDWPDEVIEGGEAYFIPAGHVLIYEEATKALEINPAHALQQCMDGMDRAAAKRATANSPAG